MKIPKWAIWVSIVLFVIIGISAGVQALFSLNKVYITPYSVLGGVVGALFIIYFISIVPIVILYEKVKK